MKIIFFILSFLHFLQGQDKMILKSGEEIILKREQIPLITMINQVLLSIIQNIMARIKLP